MKEKLGKGMLQNFALIIIGIFATAGLLLSINNTFFGPMTAEAGMTQTQKGINDLIDDIMDDKTLSDSEKAMLVEVFRNFSADYITSMDDAKLVINKLLESGLLTDEQEDLLNNILAMIDSGEITDVGLVKSIISNMLLGLKNYIVGEKSATYNKIEALIEDIKGDNNLTEEQKGSFVNILYTLIDDDLGIKGLDDKDNVIALINELLEKDMITDPVTENTLKGLAEDLKNGKNIDSRIIKETLKYAFTQMMGDQMYDDDQKAYLLEVIQNYTNVYNREANFDNTDDAIRFLDKILNSDLVKEAHIIRDGRDAINNYANGGTLDVADVNSIINRALEEIRNTLMTEKVSILSGTSLPNGADAEEYYRMLVARFTSSQFNYLETLALSNQSDLEALKEQIDQNMILTDEQREKILKMIDEYQIMSGEAITGASEDLKKAIDDNADMDSKTKATLITMINNLDSENAMSIDELKKKLGEEVDSLAGTDAGLKKDLENAIDNLNEADKKNFKDLKSKIEDLKDDTDDNFEKTSQTMAAMKRELNDSDLKLKNDISALDEKTAMKIRDLAENTDDRINTLEANTNNRIDNLEADTNEKINNLESDMNDKIDTLETDTNEKINLLREDMNTNIALLQADIADVEQSVVDTNANMEEMNTNLIARDEDMKSALDVSMAASFATVSNAMSDIINNTETNFNALYNTFKTQHNAVVGNLGMQTNYTITTDANGDPVITFTPYGSGFTPITGDFNMTTTDDPGDVYTVPQYQQ